MSEPIRIEVQPEYPITITVETSPDRPAWKSCHIRICRGGRDVIVVGGLDANEAEIRAELLRRLLT